MVIERLQNITEEMELKSEFRFSIEEMYYPPYSIDEDNENIKVIKIFSDVTGLHFESGIRGWCEVITTLLFLSAAFL